MNTQTEGIKDNKSNSNEELRLKKIEEFQLNPQKVIFETLEELQSIIPIIQKIQSDKDLEKIVGQDGKTPVKGVDYLTDEELQELEKFILERLPKEDVDYPSMQKVWEWIGEEVNSAISKIPKPKDGKTPTKEEILTIIKDYKDELKTPELTGKQIIKKIKEVKSELKLNFKDILGSRPVLNAIKNTKERIDELEKEAKNINVQIKQVAGTVQQSGSQDLSGYQKKSEKGQPNGYAGLDGSGKVPASQLPSFIDDVLEYDTKNDFPSTGETGKIYVAKDTNKTYRWSGSDYIEISSNDGSIDTHSDVDTTGKTNGQVLKWDGSKWTPQDEATQSCIYNSLHTTDPTASDDSTKNYCVGSEWYNEQDKKKWYCKDATAGNAVWSLLWKVTQPGNLTDDNGNQLTDENDNNLTE